MTSFVSSPIGFASDDVSNSTRLEKRINKTKQRKTMGEQFHRSVERAFENAIYSSDLILTGRNLREFPPIDDETRRDLSDTINAGAFFFLFSFSNWKKKLFFSFEDLSRNRFIEFPSILSTFRSLERLNLYHNAIKIIPEEICQLQQLKHLDLSRNQLTNLPSIVCQLKNLEILHLNNNKIEKLPDEIGQFERLIEFVMRKFVFSSVHNAFSFRLGFESKRNRTNSKFNRIDQIVTNI